MNRNECKKYIKRAYNKMKEQKKDMTPDIIAKQMEMEINYDAVVYISYAKVAMHNLNKSATEITAYQLQKQVDVLLDLFKESEIIFKAKNL